MSYRESPVLGTASRSIEINKVLRNTYFLLAMTLAFSAVTAGIAMAMNMPPMMAIVCFVAGFIMLFIVNKKADTASGIFWVFGFTGVMGASLGPMLSMYAGLANGPTMIMQALGGTALIFFSLSAYALTTRKDFSFMGGFLMVGLVVAVVAMIANIFLAIPALSLAISAAVILIMSGLILFDTSRIIHGGETNYIRATVGLYLNVFNIFVNLLSLLGIFGGDD
ncbi:Bax inhibitor-1/YccA family protein [Rheinheimera salexigens]|uniref:BAX inhibitor protein n=1 Tax=Rheinheimera salexigens TaxID=1628148 RepID=A0A1E7Q6Y1_9GAMM|nr:Bax inhibitor-1/YccA family protein [Rheinheimera salexigens]OEY69808.1 BAX inhibitor protein [Rheinheimera salexigens]